jgi:hypothetical protein
MGTSIVYLFFPFPFVLSSHIFPSIFHQTYAQEVRNEQLRLAANRTPSTPSTPLSISSSVPVTPSSSVKPSGSSPSVETSMILLPSPSTIPKFSSRPRITSVKVLDYNEEIDDDDDVDVDVASKKPKNVGMYERMSNNRKIDDNHTEFFQTSKKAIKVAVTVLVEIKVDLKKTKFWEPFCGGEVISNAVDFFDRALRPTPDEYDIVICNSTFSNKDKILRELYLLNKPFMAMFPLECVGTIACASLFYEHGVGMVVPFPKTTFEKMDGSLVGVGTTAWFMGGFDFTNATAHTGTIHTRIVSTRSTVDPEEEDYVYDGHGDAEVDEGLEEGEEENFDTENEEGKGTGEL